MDSKYKTFKDLVDDAKARPGQVKVAASVLPGVWSIRWISITTTAGIKTNVLPYAGSAPSVTAALTGEVDAVHVSVGEALQYMQAKKLRPLIASEVESVNIPGIGKVEPITNMFPDLKKVLPMPQLLGMAIPIDTPDPVKAAITKAFTAAMDSAALKKILEAQVAAPFGWSGEKANNMSKTGCWWTSNLRRRTLLISASQNHKIKMGGRSPSMGGLPGFNLNEGEGNGRIDQKSAHP